ncbi:hypothetical protein CYMTET_44597 [Cymbomonas tetramitiformis]|uniref:Uncharacterized protein n=1 Tax=Cymbomonas tetramitiformis TaxID=36881 RepID=A0AAE0BZR3_9CHLO|nr:hypothetical protein CYMTET_44597 [Cymbomonas tetramitiformis]
MQIKDCPEPIRTRMQRLTQSVRVEGGVYKPNNGGRLANSMKAILQSWSEDLQIADWSNDLSPLETCHPEFRPYSLKKYKKTAKKKLPQEQLEQRTWDQWLAIAWTYRSNVAATILGALRHAEDVCEDESIKQEIEELINHKDVKASNASVLKSGIADILKRHAPHALPVKGKIISKKRKWKIAYSDTEEESDYHSCDIETDHDD